MRDFRERDKEARALHGERFNRGRMLGPELGALFISAMKYPQQFDDDDNYWLSGGFARYQRRKTRGKATKLWRGYCNWRKWQWEWKGHLFFPVRPPRDDGPRKLAGHRWPKRFRLRKRNFILRVVKRLGFKKEFERMVAAMRQEKLFECQAFLIALKEVSRMASWQPPDFSCYEQQLQDKGAA